MKRQSHASHTRSSVLHHVPYTLDALVHLFGTLRVFRKEGRPSPHKPLLVLYALRQLQAGRMLVSFREVEEEFKRLSPLFGPKGYLLHAEHPFWRLQHDGVWQVIGCGRLAGRHGVEAEELRECKARAGFSEPVCDALKMHPDWIPALSRAVLKKHFPEARRAELAARVIVPGD